MLNNYELQDVIESILFISGEGISLLAIAEKLGVEMPEINSAIAALKQKHSGNAGIQLVCYNDKAQFSSNPNYAEFVETVLNPIREKALTRATLETLAIVAYKQPVTRLELEEVRGVSCDYAVQMLVEHNMIEVVGRKDTPGKPLLFGTTDEFLKRFDIPDLSALPNQAELMERIKVIKEESSLSLYHDFKLTGEAQEETEEDYEFLSDEEEKLRFEQEETINNENSVLHEKTQDKKSKQLSELMQDSTLPESVLSELLEQDIEILDIEA